jgi:hypothetical protein
MVPTITYDFILVFDENAKTLSYEGWCRKWIFPSYELYVEGVGWLFKEDATGWLDLKEIKKSHLNPFAYSTIHKSGMMSLK